MFSIIYFLFYYLIQLLVCLMLLAVNECLSLDVYNAKKQFLLSLIPLYPIIKLFIINFKKLD
jgi:hypothetical protein